MRTGRERLQDILDAMDRIEERMPGDAGEFMKEEMLQVWAAYHLQVIGEAAARLSPSLRARMRQLPWPDIIALRNIIVHNYYGIDWRVIWNTVKMDLPLLREAIQLAIRERIWEELERESGQP